MLMESNRTWSDVKDQYHRSLIDRKIETRKRLLKALGISNAWSITIPSISRVITYKLSS